MKKRYIIDRFMSLCYDYMFVLILMGIITFGLVYLINDNLDSTILLILIIIINSIFYFLLYPLICLKLKGSLGKSLNDLYVEPTKGKITFGRVLFREVVMKQLLYITVVGFIIGVLFFLKKKEMVHDYYLKTTVKKKEIEPIKKEKKKSLFKKNK